MNVHRVGHWQPQAVDIILTPSAISKLDCNSTGILVVAQANNEKLLIFNVTPSLLPLGTG